MKYLIVGLGNIGQEYKNTRHNIGFKVVDALADKKGASFEPNKQGETAKFKHRGRTFILLKPSTYMNLSGKAVRYWMQKEKIPIDRVIIIVDDLNLPFGKIRLRAKGSDGGHNGLKSLNSVLGQNNYPRIRIGVGNDFHKGKQVEYVLGKWSDEENEKLPEIINKTVDAILGLPFLGIAKTMTELNK
ncbi:MAG TPA: aminoacyl-tRNA hydrolase [Saprospiraceae bacterium]|nr:aminoacyl-tRNA hydrolase [Saprospiraceae bacterium]